MSNQKPMTTEDKAAIQKIMKHCEKIGELLDTLSPGATQNIINMEGSEKVTLFEVAVYAELLTEFSE